MAIDKQTELEIILKKFIREQSAHNKQMEAFVLNQETTNVKLVEDVEEVKRGLYGDPKNEVPGLISRQSSAEKDIKSIKSKQARYIWWGSGLIAGGQGAFYFIKDLFHK